MNFPKRPLELFTISTEQELSKEEWQDILNRQHCNYSNKKCFKTRKSQPDVSIGTCIVGYGGNPIIICPNRFLQHNQIFLDCLHLLKAHEPGNQLHIISEIQVPGGTIDYFLVSVRRNEVRDYVGIELQALDTTGTVWPSRQKFIRDEIGISVENALTSKTYGMNWKMTAKTILMQLHHKMVTLELFGKNLVLVIQDCFYSYIGKIFNTSVLRESDSADPFQLHTYHLEQENQGGFSLELSSRYSTTTLGIETMLGMRKDLELSEQKLIDKLKARVSHETLLKI
jgi:hypothetical protein